MHAKRVGLEENTTCRSKIVNLPLLLVNLMYFFLPFIIIIIREQDPTGPNPKPLQRSPKQVQKTILNLIQGKYVQRPDPNNKAKKKIPSQTPTRWHTC